MSVKKIHACEKDCFWNPATCNCGNGKYLGSIMDKIICDETTDVKETNFNLRNISCNIYLFFY